MIGGSGHRGKTVGEDAALEIILERPFHVGRNAVGIPVVVPCEREVSLLVLLDDWAAGRSGTMAAGRARSASR